jgi:hypothetical protein
VTTYYQKRRTANFELVNQEVNTMTRQRFIAALMIMVFAAALSGCATDSGTYDPARSTAAGGVGGAAVGAAIGSIIGAATGSAATGAWVGAAAGGVIGGVGGALYAGHMNNQMRSGASAAQTYNYNPAQGNVVDINEVSVTPAQVKPGSQVNMKMAYTILTPDNAPATVTLVREVKKDGQPVGQPYQTQATNQNGTYMDQVAFSVAPNATPGNYSVTNRVISNFGSTEKVSYFTVM